MKCCDSKNIIIEKEMFVCTNCATIHGYKWIEYDFKVKEYNENIYNLLKFKNILYKRKKYLNKNYNLDDRTILFLDESFENIKNYLKLKRFPINKYLDIVYRYYCDKEDIEYIPFFKSIELDNRIILIIDESIENIKKYLKLKRFSIKKYLNIIYRYYCDKYNKEYIPFFEFIELDDNIIKILDRVYSKYPHIKIEEPLYDFDTEYL